MNFETLKKAKHILIFGYGKEGVSTHRFLSKHFPHVKLAIYRGDKSMPSLGRYDAIVVSPGISRSIFPKTAKHQLTSNTEIFLDNLTDAQRNKVIGITGTKGKSTTAKFCSELLSKAGYQIAIGGNYGSPLLDHFDALTKGKLDFVIAELSSYQLEPLRVSPGIALFLNIFPDHLDRHKNFKAYFAAKRHIYEFQKPDNICIASKALQSTLKPFTKGHRITFASPLGKNVFPKGSAMESIHMRQNLGCLIVLAKYLHIKTGTIKETAVRFKPLPHRLEDSGTKGGVTFIDDANAVNPTAVMASIAFLGNRLGSLILGGKERKQNFLPLLAEIKRKKAILIILASETAQRLQKNARKVSIPTVFLADSLQEAVQIGYEHTPKGKVCLLSPAAPSYGSFKNFEEKGDVFKACVKTLKSK